MQWTARSSSFNLYFLVIASCMCMRQIRLTGKVINFLNWNGGIDLDSLLSECNEIELTDDGESVKKKQKTKTEKSEKIAKSKTNMCSECQNSYLSISIAQSYGGQPGFTIGMILAVKKSLILPAYWTIKHPPNHIRWQWNSWFKHIYFKSLCTAYNKHVII